MSSLWLQLDNVLVYNQPWPFREGASPQIMMAWYIGQEVDVLLKNVIID